MEQIKKQNITSALREYCDRYESQTRASLTMRGVSPATITQMLNGKWEKISDEMWRNVAAQIDYKDERWEAVETMLFKRLTAILTDAQENALVMAVCGDAGSGKTFASKHYAKLNRQVFMLCCNEYWNRKDFLQELLQAMGRDFTGASVSEMMRECVRALKVMEHPLLILDEADKLSDSVLYFFITLYNQLEDECGIVLCATNHLEKKLSRGIKLNRKGYTEIWSRIGRKCIPLRGVSAKDIAKVCEANGVCDHRDIDGIIEDSDCDLRRVKRKVHATIKAKVIVVITNDMARRALSINDIKAYNPKILEFEGAWRDAIGCPELKGTWLVWGGSANGKTRFALQLAKYLCKFGRVVYDSLEEGLSLSLRMAILQVGMVDVRRKFTLLDKMRVNELREVLSKKKQSPNIVIIDSLQYTGMSYKEYQDLRDSFPNKLFVFISHADGRNPKGDVGKSVRYDANVKIYVEGYKAFPQSRYGGGKAFTIWQEGAERYWT